MRKFGQDHEMQYIKDQVRRMESPELMLASIPPEDDRNTPAQDEATSVNNDGRVPDSPRRSDSSN